MRWHQVYQALIALAFSAWISHLQSIVSYDDGVNELPLNGYAEVAINMIATPKASEFGQCHSSRGTNAEATNIFA
jgi:hypothetical protein